MKIEPLINIINLSFGYKTPLCSNVELKAEHGDLICLIGLNGSGKSTFLNTICGILPQIKGEILINGVNLKNINLIKRSQLISFVPTKIDFTSNLSVRELAEMGRSPYTNIFDKKNTNDFNIIENYLTELKLLNFQNRQLWSLSDGEKQKAMIARALIQETPIIILDEPSAFLDYKMKLQFLNILKNISENKNKCVIFSSHDLENSIKFATKIWFIENSNILNFHTNEFLGKMSNILK